MKAIWRFIRNEPVRVAAGVIAVANVLFGLGEAQEDAIRNIVESLVVLVGGEGVRAGVTPTSKLEKKE